MLHEKIEAPPPCTPSWSQEIAYRRLGEGPFFISIGGIVKKRRVDPWFPFWIDKWLFGSTRIELEPDERGVFVDLLSLSKKDSGFIRANEGVPYLESQLCGLLNITSELFQRTVKKCIKYGKTEKLKDGTLYMTSYEIYSLSDRQERRVEKEMAGNGDTIAKKTDTKNIIKEKRIDKKRTKKNNMSEKKPDDVEKSFEILWKDWPAEGRFKKKYCLMKFKALCKQGLKEKFRATTIGYHEFLKHKKINENFDQKCMHLSTWMNGWKGEKQYIGFEYKPKL